MVDKQTETFRIIESFIKSLENEIILKEVILFGSYAKGEVKPYSDIDLIVVSPSFAKKKHIENMQYLFRKAAKINSLIEPIPATPEEIAQADRRSFLGQAIKAGEVVYRVAP